MADFDLIECTAQSGQDQDRAAGDGRAGRAAPRSGRQDRAGGGPHPEPRRAGRAARSWAWPSRCGRASPPAAGRRTWRSLATIRSSTTSAAACSRRWASALSCSRRTWPRAATSAPWTSRAASPTGGPGRIATEVNEKLVALLREHRAARRPDLRGDGEGLPLRAGAAP